MKAHPDYWRSVPLFGQRFHPWRLARQNRAYEQWAGVYEELPTIGAPVLRWSRERREDLDDSAGERGPPGREDPRPARLVRFRGAGHGLMCPCRYGRLAPVDHRVPAGFLKALRLGVPKNVPAGKSRKARQEGRKGGSR